MTRTPNEDLRASEVRATLVEELERAHTAHESTVRDLNRTVAALGRATEELTRLRESRVWRLAETLRRIARPKPSPTRQARTGLGVAPETTAQASTRCSAPGSPTADIAPQSADDATVLSRPDITVLTAGQEAAARMLLCDSALDAIVLAGTTRQNQAVLPPIPFRALEDGGFPPAVLVRRHIASTPQRALQQLAEGLLSRVAYGPKPGFILDSPAEPSSSRRAVKRGHRRLNHPSIVIPTRDNPAMLRQAIASVERAAAEMNVEIIVVDNGSSSTAALDYLDQLHHRVIRAHQPFNFPRLVQAGVDVASGDAVILLNDDVEAHSSEWIAALLDCLDSEHCGVAGALLVYPDETIQHCGIVMHQGEPVHALSGLHPTSAPIGLLEQERQCTAVTGACLGIRRDTWNMLGGMDPLLAQNYNDVDLCLRARRRGLSVAMTPAARLVHHESATRGAAWNAEIAADRIFFRSRWRDRLALPDSFWPDDLDVHLGSWPSEESGINALEEDAN